MPQPRYWIPEPVTPETIIYRRCYRCGIDVSPQSGHPRKCWDCHDREQSQRKDALIDRAAELAESGASQRQIAATIGVSKGTVANWLADMHKLVSA